MLGVRAPDRLILFSEDAKSLLDTFIAYTDSVVKSQGLGPQVQALNPAMAEKAAMSLLTALGTSASKSTVPAEGFSAVAKILESYCDNGAWKEGVTVAVNGAHCASPSFLSHALGYEAPLPAISLEEALARRRGYEPAAASKRPPRR